MKNKKLLILLLAGFPWMIITGMVAKAYLPVLTGKSYLLPVKARDPRDFFRGNYASLQYDFSTLNLQKTPHDLDAEKSYAYGDALCLAMQERGGVLKATGLYAKRPASAQICLKVQPEWRFSSKDQSVSLVAGLESYFAPKKEALEWESALREGRVLARVSIDHSGNARLTGLELREKERIDPKSRGDE